MKKPDQLWSDLGKRYCDYLNLGVVLYPSNIYNNTGCLLRVWMKVRFYIPRVSTDGYQYSNTRENSYARMKMAQTR